MNRVWTTALTVLLGCAPAGSGEEAPTEAPDEFEPPPLDELWNAGVTADAISVPADVLATRPLGPAPDEVSKRIVGDDGRQPVANTRSAPFASIVALFPHFPNAARPALCSGVLIADDAVLTAGHCVYDARRGGYAKTTRVVPAAYTDAAGTPVAPFGSTYAVAGRVTEEFKAAREAWSSREADFGVLRLKHPIGQMTGTLALEAITGPLENRPVVLAGYHGDKYSGTSSTWTARALAMQTSHDKVRKVYGRNFNHYADSKPGSSGSPLFSQGDLSRVIAIHIAGPETPEGNPFNIGVLITSDVQRQVEAWLR